MFSIYALKSTLSHKNTYLCATLFYVPYCTFRHSFKEKCPPSGAKTQVKYVKPGTILLRRYRYILLFFIQRLQKHIAAVQNSNIRGLSLKVNAPNI